MSEKNIIESKLKLKELYFDKIVFNRLGDKNSNKPESKLMVQIGELQEEDLYKIVLIFRTTKKGEYEIDIELSGIFSFESEIDLREEAKKVLIQKNTVAIMMPYIRSQLTLITSQPGVDPIVLPPLNINAMLND